MSCRSNRRLDTKIRLLQHKQAAGGQAATTMVGLQRLGFKTAYAGRFARMRKDSLDSSCQSESVDTEFAEVIEGARNQVAFIIVDAATVSAQSSGTEMKE